MVKERHELIRGAIGVFDEEERAYWLVTELSGILPTIILYGGLIDILLTIAYMKFFHPWKGILSNKSKSSKDASSKEDDQLSDKDVEIGAGSDDSESKVVIHDDQDQNDRTR